MTRTPPAAVVEAPGNFITSALFNTQVGGLYSFVFNPPYFKGIATTAQSIPAGGAWTPITLTSAVTDTEGGWSSSSNPNRYTFQTAGRYLCIGNTFLPSGTTTDTTERGVGLWVNAVATRLVEVANGPNIGFQGQAVYTGFFNVGDYIQLECAQNYTAALNTQVASAVQQPSLELIWMGAH